ncbi:MAG TPA: hypothetical protein VN442_14255 [Bryobacteraceae bacterium]|nr:hypothetical protein [Bryobacteraceae bacterium]
MDPMQVLIELAEEIRSIDWRLDEWHQYHRERHAEWFDDQWKEDARKIKSEPLDEPGRSVWRVAREYFDAEPLAIEKSRGAAGGWYVYDSPGCALSIEYVKYMIERRKWEAAKERKDA